MIARKSTLIIVSHFTEAVMAYVALFFVSRYMGPNDYGILGFAMGFVGLFTVLANLGFNSAHIKHISAGKDRGTCIGTFFFTKIGLIGLMSAVTIGAVLFWKIVLQRGFESNTHELAIFIILGYYVFEQLAAIFQSTFSAELKIAKKEIPRFIDTFVRTAAIIYVALAGYGAIALALTYVLGHFFLFLTSILLFRKYQIKKPTKECFKEYSKFAWPLIIVSSASVIITNFDRVLIQLFWSSAEVGYYFASFRIVGFIVLAGSSIGMIIFPTISSYHSSKDDENIKYILYASERYISLFTFPIVIGLVVLAEPAIHILLSDSFAPALPIFWILPFYALLYAWIIPFESFFLGINKPNMARNRMLMMVVTNVVLNVIFVPRSLFGIHLLGLGAVGSGLATVFSYLIGFIFYKIAVWKELKIKGNWKVILHLLAATSMGVILYLLSTIIVIERFYQLLFFALIGLGIYFGILYLIKEFTRKDLDFILDTINIRKMYKYIKEEIKRE